MNAPTTTPEVVDFETRVSQFVKLRDKIKELKDKHEEELKPYNECKSMLEGVMLEHLNQVGADSVGTSAGTVSRSRKDSATIADMSAFWAWVTINGEFDMVDRKCNVTACREYIQTLEEKAKEDPSVIPMAPPGVSFTSIFTVGVRRKTGSK